MLGGSTCVLVKMAGAGGVQSNHHCFISSKYIKPTIDLTMRMFHFPALGVPTRVAQTHYEHFFFFFFFAHNSLDSEVDCVTPTGPGESA